jgi:hypothetical protein
VLDNCLVTVTSKYKRKLRLSFSEKGFYPGQESIWALIWLYRQVKCETVAGEIQGRVDKHRVLALNNLCVGNPSCALAPKLYKVEVSQPQ